MPIRTRLTFMYALLLALAMLIFSLATLNVLKWTMRRQVDDTLLQSAEDIRLAVMLGETSLSVDPLFGELLMSQINNLSAPGLFAQIWLIDPDTGESYPYEKSWSLLGMGHNGPLDEDALDSTEEERRDVMINNYHMRVITVPLEINGEIRGHIQVASSLRTVDAAMERLVKIMLIFGAATMLAAMFLGDNLTIRALRPIETIAQTARQITAADDLSRRIPYESRDELGELTRTFNQTLERLERLFNAQRRFVADVSHEMRTPLTTIRGNISLMRRIGYDQEAMAAIDGEAQRMTRLVEDLLLLAKADAGRLSLEKTPVDLDTLVLEVYKQAQILSDGAVSVQLGPFDQARVLGDSDRLKQLLLNLVSNGVKYTPRGGSVTISVIRGEGTVRVDVTDTGFGIPPEDLTHIFDRFYRVDKARSRAMGGTGLGLSIARWIAEAHDGQLHVTSEVGKGSTFSLTLPLMPESPAPAPAKQDTPTGLKVIRLNRHV